ncbi:uncharacterized protein L969DRAFT_89995 [Mixia osmundae IAM 14324]|nr:uncharacterized protein L969DRAFT_89995 [Mixia osmundae IAM 14324]KEI37449.1 hypothetical protein L969DRAFT_89995 [Mixia osmundae IAM 14324]
MAEAYTFSARPTGSNQQSAAMDQAYADVVLLSQALSKSKRVTERMTGLLRTFDDRLVRLEKSVVGINRSTTGLSKTQKNVEAALVAIDALLGGHDSLERERAIITKGPRDDTTAYMASMTRLVTSLKQTGSITLNGPFQQTGVNSHESAAQMSSLLETGAKQIVQLFTAQVREASPERGIDLRGQTAETAQFPPIPAARMDSLRQLAAFVQKLPSPANRLDVEMQKAYGEIRGKFMAASLEPVAKQVVDFASSQQPLMTMPIWMDLFFAFGRSEYQLASSVFAPYAASFIFKQVVPPSLALFAETGQSINAIIKKDVSSSVAVAFEVYAALKTREDRFEELIRSKSGRRENELVDLAHAFRGSCLRSLPEFLEETRAWGIKQLTPTESMSAAIATMTVSVINFLRQLSLYQDAAEGFLQTLGDGNWTFGASRPGPTATRSKGQSLLSKYSDDVFYTLLGALDARTKSLRTQRAGVAAIFLLNNLTYVRREIHSSGIDDVLSEQCEDELNKRNRTAKAAYLEIIGPLVGCLMDAAPETGLLKTGLGAVGVGTGGRDRAEVKDRFARFNEALEEIENLHATAKLASTEPELKARLQDETNRMVLPTYKAFFNKHKTGEFTKNPSRYLRVDPDQLQARLNALYQ